MRIIIVGGDFNKDGDGKPSKIVDTMANAFASNSATKEVTLYNGGDYSTLGNILDSCENADVIMWFPRVSNELDKVRDIKAKYPNKMLVTSKANFEGKYKLKDIVAHALMLKSNLVVEFVWGNGKHYFGRVIDPLGCIWKEFTPRMDNLATKIAERLSQLRSITRSSSIKIGEAQVVAAPKEWIEVVKNTGEMFHKIISPAEGITRFLGNASFRCESGFPSFKTEKGEIYVSRRNVDKREIDENAFVRAQLGVDGTVEYWGNHKPSVDTPIQLRLYRFLPKIRFMLHSHVYVTGCPFTKVPIPCGGLQEVDEVMKVIQEFGSPSLFKEGVVNLIGHGCLAMANGITYFKTLKFYSRPNGESMEKYNLDKIYPYIEHS